jgi:hypothetical protein
MVPSITMLIMYLLTRELRFERSLASEHVEDIRMDKRLNWLSPKDMFAIGHANVLALYRTWDMMMRPHLEIWQNRMRACFDYRMLRDWGYGRHWKKMFVVLDEQLAGRAAVEIFRNWASHNGKLAYDMFSVHPVFKDDIPDGDICTVCYCDWEDTDLVME